tara:strand:- start:253 stop:738 length:486 start_codon:yes stop_codon:yes gene_type:complete
MSGVDNIDKWKKAQGKDKEKLGKTLLREYARRGCTGPKKNRKKLTQNNQTFCNAYEARNTKTTRKARKTTGKNTSLSRKYKVKMLLKQLDGINIKLANCIAKPGGEFGPCFDKINKEEEDIREKISKLLLTIKDVVLQAQFAKKQKKTKDIRRKSTHKIRI